MNSFLTNAESSQEDLQNVRLNGAIYSALNGMTTQIARANSFSTTAASSYNAQYRLKVSPSDNLISPGSPGSLPPTFPETSTANGQTGPIIITTKLDENGNTINNRYISGAARLTQYSGSGSSATSTNIQTWVEEPGPTSNVIDLEVGQWAWLNPFVYNTDSTNSLQIGTFAAENDCILFSYDKNNDALITTDDQFGFRLAQQNGIGVIQKRNGGTPFSCANNSAWENITDANDIDVTTLKFTDTPTIFTVHGETMTIHNITIDIQARLVGNSDVSFTRSETIMVRNAGVNL